MDRTDTEEIAVWAVKNLVRSSKKLHSQIDSNDKTPSWDGNIYVYNNSKELGKKDMIGRIPVQVKGQGLKDSKKCIKSFPAEVSDLKNYYRDGGVLFFVVEIASNDKNEIFYSSLLPFDLKNILKKIKKDQKSVNIKLCSIKDINIEEICSDFLVHRKLQSTTDFTDISKLNFNELLVPSTKTSINLDEEYYVYGKQHEYFIPVTKTKIDKIIENMKMPVKINNKVFFENYNVEHTNTGSNLVLGKNIKLNMNKGTLNFSINGNLNIRLNDLNFLQQLHNFKYISISDIKLRLKSFSENDYNNILKELKFLEDLKLLFSKLKVDYKKLDLDNFTLEDRSKTITLINSLIYNNKLKFDSSYGKLSFNMVNINNINVLLLLKERDNLYKLENYFGEWYKDYNIIIRENDKSYEVSPFVQLRSDEILTCDNMDFDFLEKAILSVKLSDKYTKLINFFVLELLTAYDQNKNLKECLTLSLNLIEFILKYEYNVMFLLNKYQIIRRLRELNKNEIKELMELKNSIKDNNVMCAINIILNNKFDFEYYFDLLNKDDIDKFVKYPIYNLTKFW